MLERFFRLSENGTNPRRELVGGLTTFMTMAYIIFVNPLILKDAGVPFEGAITATCLAAGVVTLLMGLLANYPFALASGMGLNAFVAYSVVLAHGFSWQAAMAIVLIQGTIILVLVLLGFREAVMKAIPEDLRRAIGVGIGIFIAFIGFGNAGIVVNSEATLVSFGKLINPPVLMAFFGLFVTIFLLKRGVTGALLLGILIATAAGLIASKIPSLNVTLVTSPAGVVSAPSLETIGKVDIGEVVKAGATSFAIIFAFLMVDFFDTLGTVTALSEQAGYTRSGEALPRLNRVLAVDSLGAMTGGFFGASSVTTYIESAAGISEGARTGLASVVVAVLFLAAAFFSPIVSVVPSAATAPALIVTGYLMMRMVRKIDFTKIETAFPAFIIMLLIPLTYSISHGIGYGFIAYSVITLLTGKFRETSPIFHVISVLFLISFVLE